MNKQKLKPLMLVGTGSDVGKSILATGLCRIFMQDGFEPAPFKAQNMALNSYVTPEGLEIGRAQAVQAEAAGVPCHSDMNPLLLKPSSEKTSQVVLNGKPIGNKDAYDYFRKEGREELRTAVNEAFDRLASRYNPIVMEGAGSVSELNLRETDLVNMPMAIHAGASVLLVADIDRGGVFASVYGSVMLLDAEERKHMKGILINKFRGDMRLFEEGERIIEELCQIPVLGVVPYFKDIHIEEEDSVALQSKGRQAEEGLINVAVVLLRYLSNYTDFDALERDPRVNLYYTNNAVELSRADIIIIPGSKSSIADMVELRRNGVAKALLEARRAGKTIFGICGGYQLMGTMISDPDSIEGDMAQMPGLGLLPIATQMLGEKQTLRSEFRFLDGKERCQGYEIHMGQSQVIEGAEPSPLCFIDADRSDGYWLDERCMGTYMHGILDNPSVIDYLLAPYESQKGQSSFDYQQFKEEQYDKLANELRKHLDMPAIYKLLAKDD